MVWGFCFVLFWLERNLPNTPVKSPKNIKSAFFNLCTEDEGGFPDSSSENTSIYMPAHRWLSHNLTPWSEGMGTPPSPHTLTMQASQLVRKRFWTNPPEMIPIHIVGQLAGDRAPGLLSHTVHFPVLRIKLSDFPCMQDIPPAPFYHSMLWRPCQWMCISTVSFS